MKVEEEFNAVLVNLPNIIQWSRSVQIYILIEIIAINK